MLYLSGHETLVIVVVFALITVGPVVAGLAVAAVRRWRERRA